MLAGQAGTAPEELQRLHLEISMTENFTEDLINAFRDDPTLDDQSKTIVLRNLTRIKETKVNILITGATGCGKSSTINALFNSNKAKVGQGVNPETMDIVKYELDNIVLFDSPGLGDGKDADRRHSKNIIDKLYEKDSKGELLIDLVLVILDGSSRDLGTSFELINNVIIPNLGDDKNRLLIAINQADMAMKGRYWNGQSNQPEPELVKFLDEKVESTRRRIKEATSVEVEPIYYSAGYKDGSSEQQPYNLSKLLAFILRHTKKEKRIVFAQDINKDEKVWAHDDGLKNYRAEIKKSLIESVRDGAATGAAIGSFAGPVGAKIGAVLGGLVGGLFSLFG